MVVVVSEVLLLFLARSSSISSTENPARPADNPRVNSGCSPVSSPVLLAIFCCCCWSCCESFKADFFFSRCRLLLELFFGALKSLSGPKTLVEENPPGGAGQEFGRSCKMSVDKAKRINTLAIVPFLPYLSLAIYRK